MRTAAEATRINFDSVFVCDQFLVFLLVAAQSIHLPRPRQALRLGL